ASSACFHPCSTQPEPGTSSPAAAFWLHTAVYSLSPEDFERSCSIAGIPAVLIPGGSTSLKVPTGNRLDASACQCVGAAVRNRQNQLRPSSPLWPVATRQAMDNAPSALFVANKAFRTDHLSMASINVCSAGRQALA